MQNYGWLWFWLFMSLIVQGDYPRRRLRVIEAKLDAALRTLGDNPTQVETGLERRDQVAEADAKALALRSVSLGLTLMLICGAIGALDGNGDRINSVPPSISGRQQLATLPFVGTESRTAI